MKPRAMDSAFIPLNEKEITFVSNHLSSDPAALALLLHKRPGVDKVRIIQQVAGRQKAKDKLPEWYDHPDLFFPAPLSVEQASSSATARYKASLTHGDHLVDLTLGMGVDALAFSKRFRKITGYEVNQELAAITRHNLPLLGAKNVQIINQPAERFAGPCVDCVYVDPARRDAQKRKTVAFENCLPDIVKLLPSMQSLTSEVVIKASPLIDIDLGLSQLTHVAEIHVVGYQKECKEVVFVIKFGHAQPAKIHAVVVDKTGHPLHRFVFTREQERVARAEYGDPHGYFYEPHPAFMKAGAFHLLATEYGLKKVAPNTHLYSSDKLRTDFPGRLFQITEVVNASTFSSKRMLPEGRANLTLRNFPGTPDDLRKKWRLKEGGQDYLFATTLSSKRKVVVMTQKIAT